MLAAHIINPLEWFELAELARAAFDYYTEAFPIGWWHSASDYAVYDDKAVQIGSLLNNRYHLHSPDDNPYLLDYFAFLSENNEITTRTYATYGRLEKRYLFTSAGQKRTLVERSRRIEGVNYARLDDGDQYRSLVDAAPVMLESGNIAGYVAIWGRQHFSVFIKCSSCWDLFHLREGCNDCAGRGFVEDRQCPSKLPSWLTERAVMPGGPATERSVSADDASHIMLSDTTIPSSNAQRTLDLP